jgi:phosphatidylglycerol:prolipoprotein diacylglycerol transferase
MYPLLLGSPAMYLPWAIAAVICIGAGLGLAERDGFSRARSAAVLAVLAVSIALGSKLLYLLEAHFFPGDDYVPLAVRGAVHGFRLPGGILAFAAVLPLACRLAALPWRRFGDAIIPVAALAVVLLRLTCFANGCCFGTVSGLPWALAFPHGSLPHWYQASQGMIATDAPASLPVHPLQLYLAAAGLLSLAVLLWQRRRPTPPGQAQLVFYTLFFGTTALIEPWRANFLTLNNWISPLATACAAGLLAGSWLRSARPQPTASSAAGAASGPALR